MDVLRISISACRPQVTPFPIPSPFGTRVSTGTSRTRNRHAISVPIDNRVLGDSHSKPHILWTTSLQNSGVDDSAPQPPCAKKSNQVSAAFYSSLIVRTTQPTGQTLTQIHNTLRHPWSRLSTYCLWEGSLRTRKDIMIIMVYFFIPEQFYRTRISWQLFIRFLRISIRNHVLDPAVYTAMTILI